MRREQFQVHSDRAGLGTVLAYGHYGRPVLVFPTDMGKAQDFEEPGMVAAVSQPLEEGRVKLLLRRQL